MLFRASAKRHPLPEVRGSPFAVRSFVLVLVVVLVLDSGCRAWLVISRFAVSRWRLAVCSSRLGAAYHISPMGPISPIRSRSHNPSPSPEPLAPPRTANPSPFRFQLYFPARTRHKNPFVNRFQELVRVFAGYMHQTRPITDNPAEG